MFAYISLRLCLYFLSVFSVCPCLPEYVYQIDHWHIWIRLWMIVTKLIGQTSSILYNEGSSVCVCPRSV